MILVHPIVRFVGVLARLMTRPRGESCSLHVPTVIQKRTLSHLTAMNRLPNPESTPDGGSDRRLVRRCESCRGDLIRKPYCPPCEGAGFFGAPMDEMENACGRCNGTGEAQPGEYSVWRWTCEKCGLIYPTNSQADRSDA